jgi:hypothetical protein
VLSSTYCDNQAFAMGKHLGFQCHIEMTESMIREWCAIGGDEIAAARSSPGVQQPGTMFEEITGKVAMLNSMAESVYTRWVEGLAG